MPAFGPGCVKTHEESILHLSNGGVSDERIYSRRRSPPSDLVPERLDEYIAEDNAVRGINVFLDDLDESGQSRLLQER